MANYHYVYAFGPDPDSVNAIRRKVVHACRRAGVEAHKPASMAAAPSEQVYRVLAGLAPEDNKWNWLLHIPEKELERFASEKVYAHTIRLQDQGRLADVLGGVFLNDRARAVIRTRQAAHTNEGPPFSYDPAQEYYTEPEPVIDGGGR